MTGQFGHASLNDHGLSQLAAFITDRIASHFSEESISAVNALSTYFSGDISAAPPLRDFLRQRDLPVEAQVLILLALAPHLEADFYDRIIQGALPRAGDFPQIGGSRGKNFRGLLPTGETALFLLAGKDAKKRTDRKSVV